MSQLWKCLFALSLSALLLSPALADDEKTKKKGNAKASARKEQPAVQLPKDITLTDDQKAKVAEIEKEFAPKMKEAREKLDKVLTEEQKKARQDVLKEARTSSKKGKELQQAIQDALKLSDEQKKNYDEADKALAALRLQIRDKVEPILTDEQKAKLPKRPAANTKKKPKEKKAA